MVFQNIGLQPSSWKRFDNLPMSLVYFKDLSIFSLLKGSLNFFIPKG